MQPRSIIIDTDIGDDIDDALALVVALHSPEIEVVGVTTVFRDAPRRAILTRELLRLLKREEVPIVAGCSMPLLTDLANFPSGGPNVGRQFEALDPNLSWDDARHATDFIIATARSFGARGETLTLVPIGALTNIALAFHLAPDIVASCQIVMMGGCWREPRAEWNIKCDPEAAAMVFRAGADINMVGIDVTVQCVLDDAQVQQFRDSSREHARFLGRLIDLWSHPVTLHDPLTVLTIFTDLVKFEPKRIEIGLSGDERARTLVVEGEPNCRVAVEVDAERAKALFLERVLAA